MVEFINLPKFMLYTIGSMLSPKDIYCLMMTCDKFNHLFNNESFWLYKLKKDFEYHEPFVSYKKIYSDFHYKKNAFIYKCQIFYEFVNLDQNLVRLNFFWNFGFPKNDHIDKCILDMVQKELYKTELHESICQRTSSKLPSSFKIINIKLFELIDNQIADFYVPLSDFISRYYK